MKRTALSLSAVAFAAFAVAAVPAPEPWNVDVPHTGVDFSVKHFFTPVSGSFESYNATLLFDAENPENSSVRVSIDVSSIETGNEDRNAHLMSEDFFEVETYPYITFVSESVRRVSADRLMVRGALKIKGQVRDVELPVTILGIKDIPQEMQGMLGGVTRVASFEAALTIDRRDFNVGVGSWAATAVVGKDVNISIALEANRK